MSGPGRLEARTMRMSAAAVAVLVLSLPAAGPARAADMLVPATGDAYREPPRPAIVVPGCSDSIFRTLMTCAPREATLTPGDPGLAAIEGTIVPHGKPYGELFTSPRQGEPRRP